MKNILNIKIRENLKISELKKGEVHRMHLHIPGNSLGIPWKVPVIVVKGVEKGPTLGITAAVHGNELNGLSTIFKLLETIDPTKMAGTLVCVPISNIPGYMRGQRYFSDGQDLNRIMPGRPIGKKPSEIYAYYYSHKIVKHFDYLLDLHTASDGRINSLYIRADLEDPKCRELAYFQNPHIIVQKYDEDGTLRAWANDNNIPAITIEIGNPNTFQKQLIDECLDGITNTMIGLGMLKGKVKNYTDEVFICSSSHWIYSQTGGILEVFPGLTDEIKKGQTIGKVFDVFGQLRDEIVSEEDGVVIGKSTHPACEAGTRIVHIGVK